MSKSLGNSLTIRDALQKYNHEVIRYVMLSKHYTSDIDLVDEEFNLAESHMYYFYSTIAAMEKYIATFRDNSSTATREDDISSKIIPDFINSMDDDFNSAAALSNLHGIFKYANNIMKTAKKGNRVNTEITLVKILDSLHEAYGVIGMLGQNPEEFISEMKMKYLRGLEIDEAIIESKISERTEAKKSKNFELADAIRAELDSKGIILMDTVDGTKWDIKALFSYN